MEKKKKLRLLVTGTCNNRCPMCCNNHIDLNALPVVDRWDYEEIKITGGEPLLFPNNLERLCDSIRELVRQMGGTQPKIYIYTSRCRWDFVDRAIRYYADGLVVAPHSKDDLAFFRETNNKLLRYRYGKYQTCDLQLRVFDEVKEALPENLNVWDVSRAEWSEHSSIPEDEDFRRVSELWIKDKW